MNRRSIEFTVSVGSGSTSIEKLGASISLTCESFADVWALSIVTIFRVFVHDSASISSDLETISLQILFHCKTTSLKRAIARSRGDDRIT
jgi:hypothetical protein